MKVKLLNLLNKILKRFAFLGIFSFSTSSADAQTVYQCLPCPEGQSSPAGSTSASQCTPVCNISGEVIKNCTTSNCSGTLSKGWYRVTLMTEKAEDGYPEAPYNKGGPCHFWNGRYMSGSSVSKNFAAGGVGGAGLTKTYVFYLSQSAGYSYTYNNGSPRIVINSTSYDPQRIFQLSAPTKGKNPTCTRKETCGNNGYPECCDTVLTCVNGVNGKASEVIAESGLRYRDSANCSAKDGTSSSTGIRISKIS